MKPLLKIWIPLVILTLISYAYIDRPLCDFIFKHAWPQHLNCLKNLVAGWPPLVTSISPFLFFGAFLFKPGKARTTLLLISLSIILTFVLKNDLKWVFSRYWPLTWVNNNISWVTNHAYGFKWFQGAFFQASDATGSFPSGHTAIAFATFLPVGLIYKRSLHYCIVLASLEGLAMVAFDFHFLSDVFAGALVGITCVLVLHRIVESKGYIQGNWRPIKTALSRDFVELVPKKVVVFYILDPIDNQ